jgi:glyoxylase-like metal-dependent hydrolase (beta-lactamase superfamily II)
LTTVVARDADSVRSFFGFTTWPAEVVRFDLGGRELEITGIPGHHAASIAVYDPQTAFLLTGDTVYPGRLYAPDFPAFRESLERLTAFAAARDVSQVLGCHIEMTRAPGRDYPLGCRYQPEEPALPMTVTQLEAIRDAAAAARPGVRRSDDFIIYAGPCKAGQRRLAGRALLARLRRRLPCPQPGREASQGRKAGLVTVR